MKTCTQFEYYRILMNDLLSIYKSHDVNIWFQFIYSIFVVFYLCNNLFLHYFPAASFLAASLYCRCQSMFACCTDSPRSAARFPRTIWTIHPTTQIIIIHRHAFTRHWSRARLMVSILFVCRKKDYLWKNDIN